MRRKTSLRMWGTEMAIFAGDPTPSAIEALYATAHWLFEAQRHRDAACVFRAMMLAAPTDERAWIGLGACHEEDGEDTIALELYVSGALAANPAGRCEIARARLLRANGFRDEALQAIQAANDIADERGDDDLRALVQDERAAR
jgi:tetratricopeptide (TPR) repeat protein